MSEEHVLIGDCKMCGCGVYGSEGVRSVVDASRFRHTLLFCRPCADKRVEECRRAVLRDKADL